MTSEWETLQKLVEDEMRQLYSETVVYHALNPRNLGDIPRADGYARITSPCGDTLMICSGLNAFLTILLPPFLLTASLT
ncbi:hypothetical protein ACFLWB_02135 [Chloroflexota bacterium]